MIVPEGYISFKDVGRTLACSYVYADDTQPNGQDFNDGAWCDELWKVAEQLQIKGATGVGIILDIPADDRRETASRGWYGVHADYTPFENEWLDLSDGRIIAGDFKGCMIVIPKVEWETYLRERRGNPANLGGRPRLPAFEWYKARGFKRNGMTLKQLRREMPCDKRGNKPSDSTILSWENEFLENTPAGT